MTKPTERFSSRVENYVRYRPSFPPEIVAWLASNCELTTASIVADVGSGTGILSELFLRNGNVVYGVEPNAEMRAAGERLLQKHPGFRSVAGTAENTTLPAASVDFVTAGQAFHWFDQEKSKAEFARILKPRGWCVLIWNERLDDSTPFASQYERLLQSYSSDYGRVDHRQIGPDVLHHFLDHDFQTQTFSNRQVFDFDGLKGRLLSSSYAPEAGHPQHAPMLADLRSILDAHQINGEVTFEYDAKVYCGRLS